MQTLFPIAYYTLTNANIRNINLTKGEIKNTMIGVAVERTQKAAYSIKEAARETSLSVPYIRNLIRDGDLKAKKAGRRLLILDTDLRNYLENLGKFK